MTTFGYQLKSGPERRLRTREPKLARVFTRRQFGDRGGVQHHDRNSGAVTLRLQPMKFQPEISPTLMANRISSENRRVTHGAAPGALCADLDCWSSVEPAVNYGFRQQQSPRRSTASIRCYLLTSIASSWIEPHGSGLAAIKESQRCDSNSRSLTSVMRSKRPSRRLRSAWLSIMLSYSASGTELSFKEAVTLPPSLVRGLRTPWSGGCSQTVPSDRPATCHSPGQFRLRRTPDVCRGGS